MPPETLGAPEMIGAFERHLLPNGVEVFYREADHSYYAEVKQAGSKVTGVRDARLTGVSTVVAPFDWRPDSLMSWASRIDLAGVAALAAEGLSLDDGDDMRACLDWLRDGEAILAALTDARLHHTQARDDAAQRGTNVHKHALQALATGSAVPDFSAMTEEEAGYARGVMGFWHETEPEPLLAEHVVADLELRVAGRLDLIATIGAGPYAGRTLVVDAKTSGFLPVKHHAQIAGYVGCAARCGLADPEGGLILQVTPDGGYRLIPVCASWEDFVLAVHLYRRASAIGADARRAVAA